MKLRTFWLAATGGIVFACTSAHAQPQQQREERQTQPADCGRPPYAAELAEASARASAQFQLSVARVLQNQLQPDSGTGGSPASVTLSGRVASAAAAGFAATALSDTMDNYFCRILRVTTDPQRRQALEQRQIELKRALAVYFNPALYGLSPAPTAEERREDRDNARDDEERIEQRPSQLTPLMAPDAAERELPYFNHSRVTIHELVVEGRLPGVTAEACLGMVRKSIRALPPQVLVALDKARTNYVWWISGNPVLAAQDFRLLAAQIAQNTRNRAETETQTVTPEFQTCLSDVERAAAAIAPTPTPTPTPAASGGETGAASENPENPPTGTPPATAAGETPSAGTPAPQGKSTPESAGTPPTQTEPPHEGPQPHA